MRKIIIVFAVLCVVLGFSALSFAEIGVQKAIDQKTSFDRNKSPLTIVPGKIFPATQPDTGKLPLYKTTPPGEKELTSDTFTENTTPVLQGNGSLAGLPGVRDSSIAWGDYDNDRDLDILLTGNSVGGPISKIYRNNGNGTFTDINADLTGV